MKIEEIIPLYVPVNRKFLSQKKKNEEWKD